jgi:hypothetical protein
MTGSGAIGSARLVRPKSTWEIAEDFVVKFVCNGFEDGRRFSRLPKRQTADE